MIVLLFMVLLCTLAAAFEFDNVKSYDAETKTVTVRDSLLGFPTTTVATIKLDTDLIEYVMVGKDRKVAQFTIDLNENSYDNALKQMEFFDLRRNNWKINKDFTYKYRISHPYDKPIYEETCVPYKETIYSDRGFENCSKEQIGTEIDYTYEWIKLNINTALPKGEITIGMFTDVKSGDTFEWIPTLFGVRIQEWAVWQEGFNTGLMGYWNFDEGAGTALPELTGQVGNGTVVGNLDWGAGILGNSFTFDGATYINTTLDYIGTGNEAYSIGYWAQVNGDVGIWNDVLGKYWLAGEEFYVIIQGANTQLAGITNTDGGGDQASTGTYSLDTWMYIVHTWDGTDTRTYLNGTYVSTATPGGTMKRNTAALFFGTAADGDLGVAFHGKFDEVGIWNRTLSSGEIGDLYNNGTGMTYIASFNEAPTTPVWNYPSNNTVFSSSSYDINWANSTDANEDTITYNLEISSDPAFGSITQANSSIMETSTPTGYHVTGLGDGVWYARVRGSDASINGSYGSVYWNQSTIVVNFVSQEPSDINTTAITDNLEINYTISSAEGIDTSRVKLWHKINHTEGEDWMWLNGELRETGWSDKDQTTTNLTDLWSFNVEDMAIYPGTYNFDEDAMESLAHTNITVDKLTEAVKVELYNVSNVHNGSVLEINADWENGASTPLQFWYCNSSYSTGKFTANDNCAQFSTLTSNIPDHTHEGVSNHIIVPVTIISQHIGSVFVTNTSNFLMRATSVNGWNVGQIAEENRTSAWTTGNTGIGWSAVTGTIDFHVHQFNGDEKFWYFAEACTSAGACKNTTERYDSLEVGQNPPSAPDIYAPTEGYTGDVFDINWTASATTGIIDFYNISLYYINVTHVATIVADNGQSLGYTWNSSAAGVVDNGFLIRVDVVDTIGQSNFAFSENITLNNIRPSTPTIGGEPDGTTYINGTAVYTCTGSVDSSSNGINYLFFKDGLLAQNTTNTTYTLLSTANETVSTHCYAADNLPYQQTSENSSTRSITFNTTRITSSLASYPGTIFSLLSGRINLTVGYSNYTVSSLAASLTHNGTNFSITTTTPSSTSTHFSGVVTAPIVNTNTNKTFFFDVIPTLINGSIADTIRYSYSHEILGINFTTCVAPAPGQIAIYNFTTRNEINFSHVAHNFDATFRLWGASALYNQTLSVSKDSSESTLICMVYPNATVLNADAHIQYDSPDYSVRNYYFTNANVYNYTQNISFYLIESSLDTGTKIIVQDETDRPYANHYVHVERYYPGTDTYRTVTIGKTDDAGEDYMFLRFEDAQYRFKVYDYNTLLFETTLRKLSASPVIITISPNVVSTVFKAVDGVNYALDYDNTTNTFNASFTINSDSNVTNLKLQVVQRRAQGDVVLCTVTSPGSDGELGCYTGNTSGEYYANLIVTKEVLGGSTMEQSLEFQTVVLRGNRVFFESIGANGPMFAFIIVGTVAATAATLGAGAAIIMTLLALAFMVNLGLFSFTTGSLIIIISLGVIIFIKVKT